MLLSVALVRTDVSEELIAAFIIVTRIGELGTTLITKIYIPGKLVIYFVRFEVFTAVTMKNVVFRDIKTQFVLHRRHITSPLQSPAG
jgi:hypothetical protein